jgi:hypothetical protein
MAAAALPAPSTRVLPAGGAGKFGGTAVRGAAAATAARKLLIIISLLFIIK